MTDAAISYSRWALVAFGFCVGLTVWSLGLFAPAAVLPYLHDRNGWSISLISAAVSAHFFVSALFVAGMPEIHRVIGVRGTAIAGAVSVYLGFIAWAASPLPGLLFLTAIVSGFGLACGGLATVTAVVSLGCTADRAKALGIALNGTAVGGVMLLPLLSLGAGHFGLRWTLAMLGLLAFVLLLGMSKVIDRLGSGRGEAQPEKSPPATKLTRRDLLGTARFRSLALSFSVAIFIQVGIYSQLINRLRPFSVSMAQPLR